MKKLLLVGLFLFPTLAFAQTFDTNLSYGSTGSDVSALQEFLVTQHVLAPQYVTGNFYSLTLAAVKSFQTAESISPISGYVGPITRETINSILASEVSTSEENAATTTEPVDLSATTTVPAYTPPQVIYVPVSTPVPQTNTQTFGDTQTQKIPLTSSCTDTPTLSTIATSTEYSGNVSWNANFSDTCPVDDTTTLVTFGIQNGDRVVLQSNTITLAKDLGFTGVLSVDGFPYILKTDGDGIFAGPFYLANYATTTSLYAFITIDGITQLAQIQ